MGTKVFVFVPETAWERYLAFASAVVFLVFALFRVSFIAWHDALTISLLCLCLGYLSDIRLRMQAPVGSDTASEAPAEN